MSDCPECRYLQDERAGMWLDNGAELEEAIQEGSKEFCQEHSGEFYRLKRKTEALKAKV